MISATERQERLDAVEDVIGTHRAEGIPFDGTIRALMQQYVEGELTLEGISAALDKYAKGLAPLASVA